MTRKSVQRNRTKFRNNLTCHTQQLKCLGSSRISTRKRTVWTTPSQLTRGLRNQNVESGYCCIDAKQRGLIWHQTRISSETKFAFMVSGRICEGVTNWLTSSLGERHQFEADKCSIERTIRSQLTRISLFYFPVNARKIRATLHE